MFGQWIDKVGLENIPQVQPRQVAYTGVHVLAQALKGAQIHLVHSEDCDSDKSIMDTSHDSLPRGCYFSNPLGLETEDPSDLKDGEIRDRSHPSEPMDQSDMPGHGIHSAGGAASNANAVLGGTSDFQSEVMDTTAQPSEAESHSDLPTANQDTRSRSFEAPGTTH